ncbi:Fur family transcriptional regulator [Streptosporangium sp. 'caverna']|uniref:Fur family transcriptional regulator n=1 Tax=Streptosporangium sp. 'caverna' TaxID=2202249 RepID=UPI000D7E7D2F|nr:Fur family transcriptional regulator [Streptosporangium sp. 'caverna']AWS48077.1 transcriptional repressor [Streptosporangium sp. 'caverna']
MEDEDRLRQAGLRVTAARLAIMQTVREGDHLDVEAVYRGVRGRVGQISLQAVYDSLHSMHRGGLLRRIEPAGSPARYEARVGDNHHHLVCRRCGKVTDVDCAVGHAPCLDPVSDIGYLIDEADVIFWGMCPDCRSQDAEDSR